MAIPRLWKDISVKSGYTAIAKSDSDDAIQRLLALVWIASLRSQ
jgi:hypothetical protein